MNKDKTANKSILLFSLFFLLSSFVHAQGFDDLPYSNPDRPTYFQQEMTSLMKFQAANDLNVPFFLSYSGKFRSGTYSKDYMRAFTGIDDMNPFVPDFVLSDWYENSDFANGYPGENIMDQQVLLGGQIRINSRFYIPVLFSFGGWNLSRVMGGGAGTSDYIQYTVTDEETGQEYEYSAYIRYKRPLTAAEGSMSAFLGTGLFINTEKIKGGVYAGWDFTQPPSSAFKLALIPLVNTSEWAVIGWALDSILGYLGLGDAVMLATEEGDSKAAGIANALNAALDFTFNRIHMGVFSLDAQAVYNRGNYDAAAKADTFGGKLTGLFSFSPFPVGFTVEGGYKHFFALSQIYADLYPDTGYFSGGVFFPLKRVTFGALYQYDRITHHQFSVAVSTNFLSGFFALGTREAIDRYSSSAIVGYGTRFRWGGWKAGNK